MVCRLLIITSLALLLNVFAPSAHAMQVTVNDLTFELPVLALPVLPGEILDVAVMAEGHVAVQATLDGQPIALHEGRGELTAPAATGVYQLDLSTPNEQTRINLLVMLPADRVTNGRLNGFRLDAYPEAPLRGLRVYEPPRGFIEVTAQNRNTPVSPNYTLGQFVAKQAGSYPKYVVLRPRLLIKLELIGAALREAGVQFDGFTVMSGYRTPFYNRAIGNSRYSRHVWGGAADVYIDVAPADGQMDDLNGDGKITRADAKWLWDFVNRMSREGQFAELVGGLGLYGATASHGPFVHVDVRGFVARW